MLIVEPLLIRRRRGEPLRTAHAWSEGSRDVACGKRVGGAGWLVNPVAWSADLSEYVRCPDCIIALERRQRPTAEHGD
jgi:hypothetical protein